MSAAIVEAPSAGLERRPLLRIALTLDVVVTGANGAAYLAAARPLGELLGLPAGLLRGAGVFLLLFAAAVWATSRRDAPFRSAVVAIIAVNGLWAATGLVTAIGGWESPTTAGTVWIVLQAIVVGSFAELQVAGLRRLPRRR